MNKFEQVSSDGDKMSLGGGLGGPMLEGAGWRGLMKSNVSWVMVTWGSPVNRQTHTSENFTLATGKDGKEERNISALHIISISVHNVILVKLCSDTYPSCGFKITSGI